MRKVLGFFLLIICLFNLGLLLVYIFTSDYHTERPVITWLFVGVLCAYVFSSVLHEVIGKILAKSRNSKGDK